MDSTYMSLVTSLPVVALEVIITPIKVKSNRYWVLIWVTKKEAIWIALAGLFVHVDIKYWDFFNLGGHFYYSNFLCSSNESALRFFDFALFHVFFSFCHFLSLFVTFSTIIWIALSQGFMKIGEKCKVLFLQGFMYIFASIFSNFHDPGNMKPCKNRMLQFSLISMTPGTWNLAKIGCFNFL